MFKLQGTPQSRTTNKTSDLFRDQEKKNEKHKNTKAAAKVTSNPDDNFVWTLNYDYVGRQVATYFGSGKARRLYVGTVTKYAFPSDENSNDQLYHVVFADGDEADFDEEEFQNGAGNFITFC